MIHYFRADRPGQSRGIPEITPALPLFAQLRRYTLAVIAAAETAADFAAVLYTDAPANGEADPVEPMDLVELERRMATVLPGGWRLGQIQAQQPATTYAEFKKEILNEIARCLNMPLQRRGRQFVWLQLRLRPARSPDLLQIDPRRSGPTRPDGSRPRPAGLARRGDSDQRTLAALDAHGRLPRSWASMVLGRARACRSRQGGQCPGHASAEPHDHAGLRVRPSGTRLGERTPAAGQGSITHAGVGTFCSTSPLPSPQKKTLTRRKTKMPRETVHNNPSELNFVCEPGAIKIEALAEVEAAADGTPRLPRFEMVAYTGGPMRIGGWRWPVIVDLAGLGIPSQNRPIRFGHDMQSGVGHTDAHPDRQRTTPGQRHRLARHGRREGDRHLGAEWFSVAGLDRRQRRGVRVHQAGPESSGQRPRVHRAGERRAKIDAR